MEAVRFKSADRAASESIPDEEVLERIRDGETALYEILMRRYNQRLYRVALSILGNDAEAEDVMQEAYVRAYQHLASFAGEAKFSTWLTKIAVYEALSRVRRRNRLEELEPMLEANLTVAIRATSTTSNPERQAYDSELRLVLERAISALPAIYRGVFVLRSIEELSVAETAKCLNLGEEAVKTRFHRARAILQRELRRRSRIVMTDAFPFHLSRCNRIVEGVFRRIYDSENGGPA